MEEALQLLFVALLAAATKVLLEWVKRGSVTRVSRRRNEKRT